MVPLERETIRRNASMDRTLGGQGEPRVWSEQGGLAPTKTVRALARREGSGQCDPLVREGVEHAPERVRTVGRSHIRIRTGCRRSGSADPRVVEPAENWDQTSSHREE
jgi:hypothetical protein